MLKLYQALFVISLVIAQAQSIATNVKPFSSLLQRQVDAVSTGNSSFAYNVSSCTGYQVTQISDTAIGLSVNLGLISSCQAFGNDIKNLTVNISYETQERLHVKIYDTDEQQFQIPENVWERPTVATNSTLTNSSDLVFNYNSSPFEFWITRRSAPGDAPIFDTRSASISKSPIDLNPDDIGGVDKGVNGSVALVDFPLVFEDAYLQLATSVPDDANIYGLGEIIASSGFRRNNSGSVQTFWARDVGDPVDQNEYGSHPVYLETRYNSTTQTSSSHGVFLLTSQGMDVILRTGAIEYRAIGGILDFYFVSGPTPISVIQQYSDIVGKTQMFPYWGFGFHLCRWGYDNLNETQAAVDAMRAANIPLETMWNDIDHMDTYRDFTEAPIRFPADQYISFIQGLHENYQHYIPIIDAGIAVPTNSSDNYDVAIAGTAADIWIKNPDGSDYWGQVWPGAATWPDFFNSAAEDFWTQAHLNFSAVVDFDGIWLDMNEPSSFCDGSCKSGPNVDLNNISTPFPLGAAVVDWPEGYNNTLWGDSGNITVNGSLTFNSTPPGYKVLDRRTMLSRRYGENIDINAPPYPIHNALATLALSTVSPNATHLNGSILELNVHNLFGYMEGRATNKAYNAVHPGRRPFIIGRSTFPKSGTVQGHWLGDNYSQWKYLVLSIQGILQFQLFGIPLVGADTCGFNGNTDEELCNRWMQLSAFAPFYRNHNTIKALPQEPYRWDSVAEASRTAISIRYKLLNYWYTLFYLASDKGTPPVRALFFNFPNDPSLYGIDLQFMLGDAILVSPVTTPNASSVEGVLPANGSAIWRDWYTHEVFQPANSSNVVFDAPLGHIPVHIRDSSILLLHETPAYTVKETRDGPFSVLVSLSSAETASGMAYLDDGDDLPVGAVKIIHLEAIPGKIYAWTEGYYNVTSPLNSITVLGVTAAPVSLTFNAQNVTSYSYNSTIGELSLTGLNGNLNSGWELDWA